MKIVIPLDGKGYSKWEGFIKMGKQWNRSLGRGDSIRSSARDFGWHKSVSIASSRRRLLSFRLVRKK